MPPEYIGRLLFKEMFMTIALPPPPVYLPDRVCPHPATTHLVPTGTAKSGPGRHPIPTVLLILTGDDSCTRAMSSLSGPTEKSMV